ncbi:hypothetical protein [Brucella ceti]|uniref:hypothetical protein n=1 Tax=Brucella ceti TaxID=120577 RepID=UPI0035D4072D
MNQNNKKISQGETRKKQEETKETKAIPRAMPVNELGYHISTYFLSFDRLSPLPVSPSRRNSEISLYFGRHQQRDGNGVDLGWGKVVVMKMKMK